MNSPLSWKFAASVCCAALMHGDAKAQREAKDELLRMAGILDTHFPPMCDNRIIDKAKR